MQQFTLLHYLIIKHSYGCMGAGMFLTFSRNNAKANNISSGFMPLLWENLNRASR